MPDGDDKEARRLESSRPSVDERGLAARRQVCARHERRAGDTGRRLDDATRRGEHLGEGLVGVDQVPAAAAAQRWIGPRGVGGDHLGARLQPGVDGRQQVVAQVDVDERGDAGQDDGHPGREGEREADPKRDAPARPGH